MSTATIFIDGASRGNPGPAAYAVVIQRPGEPAVEQADVIGTATNNVAEYTALVEALNLATELGIRQVQLSSDSELLVKQMNGEYKVKSVDLRDLFLESKELAKAFESIAFTHVRREQNKRADELCNLALDRQARSKPQVPALAKATVNTVTVAKTVTDEAVRADVLVCLHSAAQVWAKGNPMNPPVEVVWEQIWSILEDSHVLRKRK